MKGITNELIGAATSSMILAILKEGDNYGYEIIHKMKDMTAGNLICQESTIYPLLKKLENEKLITSYWKTDSEVRARKYFAIQEKGINKLYENKKEWNLAQLMVGKLWNFE